MSTLTAEDGDYEYQWSSDVTFDGIRLEVLTDKSDMLFDVSVPERGSITVNTFSKDVPVHLIMAAVALAEQRP